MSGPTLMSWRTVEVGGWECVIHIWNPSHLPQRTSKTKALLVKWNFLFHMVNQIEGMFVYMTGRGKEKGRIKLSPLSPFHVCFSCIKLSLCLCFMRPLIPQALCGSEIWKIVHFVGRLWQNFPRKCVENYSP